MRWKWCRVIVKRSERLAGAGTDLVTVGGVVAEQQVGCTLWVWRWCMALAVEIGEGGRSSLRVVRWEKGVEGGDGCAEVIRTERGLTETHVGRKLCRLGGDLSRGSRWTLTERKRREAAVVLQRNKVGRLQLRSLYSPCAIRISFTARASALRRVDGYVLLVVYTIEPRTL